MASDPSFGMSEEEEQQFNEWVRRQNRELAPMIRGSAVVAPLVPNRDGVDAKFAVELGFAIMLDKPLVLLVRPGIALPERLVRAADEIVETGEDWETDTGRRRAVSQINAALERLGLA